MKALSLRQPFANMIARGEKTIETRTWSTSYRGRIAICSSKSKKRYLGLHPEPPYGSVVALATITDCRPMSYTDEAAACCGMYLGAKAWILDDVVRVVPVEIRGALNLFEIDWEENDFEVMIRTEWEFRCRVCGAWVPERISKNQGDVLVHITESGETHESEPYTIWEAHDGKYHWRKRESDRSRSGTADRPVADPNERNDR